VSIDVLVREATPAGRLYAHYSEESQMLTLASRSPRAWPFGIDIDGRIVFDIDEGRVAAPKQEGALEEPVPPDCGELR
jgi:hypothetical protein